MSDMFHLATSYAEILREVQRYIDNGLCKRVDRRAGDTEDKLYPTDTTGTSGPANALLTRRMQTKHDRRGRHLSLG